MIINKNSIYHSKIKINFDERGYFFESFRKNKFKDIDFVQDNISYSKKGTLRGMHYQYKFPQSKLITILHGEIYDVIIDLRNHSKNFLKIYSYTLSPKSNNQLYIPRGFAHGFQCISENSTIYYKTDNYYQHEDQYGIDPLDLDLKIEWPLSNKIINNKDSQLPKLSDIKNFF